VITNYWNNLNERERWMAAAGVILVLVYLFYLLIYSPLTTAVNTKSQLLIEKKETLAWMQQIAKKPKHQGKVETTNNTQLLALVSSQLNDKPFKQFPYQLQQTGPGDIQLSFDRVPYQPFLNWLWALSNHYAITIKQFTAEQTDTPGVVKLLLVITAK
jgi:general secretion pathway protein M